MDGGQISLNRVSVPHPPAPSGKAQKALRQQYVTPTDVSIPEYKSKRGNKHQAVHVMHHMPTETVPDRLESSQYDEHASVKSELDGFMILEVTGMGFPEDAQELVLPDKKITSVVSDDLTFFSKMLFVDVSENHLPIYPFGAFPNLRELRIACNGISEIGELLGFQNLLYLDLSYNKLQINSVSALEVLPNLKELDLSGNNMGGIPDEFHDFRQLEKIILDYNKLEENYVFRALATAPRLRHISLANNFLSEIPHNVTDTETFRLLEHLDISFNYFGTEESVEAATVLPRMSVLVLYGNPLLGRTGEDPMYVYIEDLVERASEHREASGSTLPDIDVRDATMHSVHPPTYPACDAPDLSSCSFMWENIAACEKWSNKTITYPSCSMLCTYPMAVVDHATDDGGTGNMSVHGFYVWDEKFVTEIPRRRVLKKGQPLGRQATYRDFSIVQVEQNNIGTNREWRAKGTQTLFAETVAYKKQQQQMQPSASGASLPDFTFITNSAAVANTNPSGAAALSNNVDMIADDVMQKVAQEMGLVNSAELLLLKDRAMLPPSAVSIMEREEAAAAAAEASGLDASHTLYTMGTSARAEPEDSSASYLKQQLKFSGQRPSPAPYPHGRAEERARSSAAGGVEEQLPGTLFSRPLGDSQQQLVAQPIKLKTAMKALQTALRQPLTNYDEVPAKTSLYPTKDLHRSTQSSRLRQMPHQSPAATGKLSTAPDGTEDFLDKKTHKFNRRGLREASEVAEARQLNRDRTLSQIDDVLHGLNENTANWSERQRKIHNFHKSDREAMNEMRNFVQPFSGIRGLVDMVNEVTQEFNS